MICAGCGNNDANTLFNEIIQCYNCNCSNTISYHICRECGLIWKTIGGDTLDGVIFAGSNADQDIDDIIDKFMIPDQNFFKSSMLDIVHKCLRCNETSFEIAPKLYHCSDYGFEWEVI